MCVDSFVSKPFEVTLLLFYMFYIPKHEEDVLKVACTAGIHLKVSLFPHIHVHTSVVFNNASAPHSWHSESRVR